MTGGILSAFLASTAILRLRGVRVWVQALFRFSRSAFLAPTAILDPLREKRKRGEMIRRRRKKN
jgi:hypothetical protein